MPTSSPWRLQPSPCRLSLATANMMVEINIQNKLINGDTHLHTFIYVNTYIHAYMHTCMHAMQFNSMEWNGKERDVMQCNGM